jgi:hypothetical protein
MAYDEKLAARIREVVKDQPGIAEKMMFGGLAFILNGHMCCGIVGEELMVRVGPEAYEKSLAETHVREMNFTGRPMKGMIYIAPEGVKTKNGLSRWVNMGIGFALTLPPKKKK